MSPSHHHHRILTVTIIALAALLCPASSNADDYVSRVWVADQGDGTYINPIIHAVEGPKFYKRNGYYYILAPAGGVDKGWQIALRSRSPDRKSVV